VLVLRVAPGSEADRTGIRPGDVLASVAGHPARDALDLVFALGCAEAGRVPFVFVRDARRIEVVLPPLHPEDLGIELAPDRYRTCGNRCVFCFVDQLPPGLRDSLYVKDEDYRLSFSFGNFITLTNLTDGDYARIAEQRLSPLYVSVHATDDAVRRRMLGNPAAPPIMGALKRLRDAGVFVHAQIVVCPGMNDGPVLERSLDDLVGLGRAVLSVAVVPVGLTAHRAGLAKIAPVTPELAADLVRTVALRQKALRRERGSAVVFAADEIYLRAGADLPSYDAYEDFPQLENGVGLLRGFEADLKVRAPELCGRVRERLTVTILTAPLAADFIETTLRRELAAAAPVEVRVVPVENTLLGPTVTVAGLLPGGDMVRALRAAAPADLYLLPGDAFNDGGLTIDGMSANDVAREAGRTDVAATRDVVSALIEHAAATAG